MASGKVKWWDEKRGYGFIAQEAGQDIFLHHTSVLGNGHKTFQPGDNLVFDIVASEKGPKAENVEPLRR
jgi:CspA family cold shock protein